MSLEIVFQSDRVTLVGGGAVYAGDLEAALALTSKAVAVDGGADAMLEAGMMPEWVIGDFDSLSAEARATIPPNKLMEISEQDSTDFEKALSRINADIVLGVGFTGARMDHGLAALHALLRFAHRPIILLAEREIILLAPPRLALNLSEKATVSLFPLVPVSGRSQGLFWPINGLAFKAGQQIGTSNKACGGAMVLETDHPGAVLFLPKSELGQVTQALQTGAPEHVRWPVHA